MKVNPVVRTWWHEALCELRCFVSGHQWKSSWRKRPKVLRKEPKDGGSRWYHYSAKWRYKCRRCRRYSIEGHEIWWRAIWWGIRALRPIRIGYYRLRRGEPGYGFRRVPLHAWLVCVLTAPLFQFYQAWFCHFAYRFDLPYFPGVWAERIHHRIHTWAETKGTYYRWDSERGVHTTEENPRRKRRRKPLQPTASVGTSGGGTVSTYTYIAGDWQ